MFDIGGFLSSTEFLAQIAAIIAAVLTAFVGDFISRLFGGI